MALVSESIGNRLLDSSDVAGDTIAWLAAERRDSLGVRYVRCPYDMRMFMRREMRCEGGQARA